MNPARLAGLAAVLVLVVLVSVGQPTGAAGMAAPARSAAVAHRAHTASPPGTLLWSRTYGESTDVYGTFANDVAVGPYGRLVFVAGSAMRVPYEIRGATVAYDSATGTRVWARQFPRSPTFRYEMGVAQALAIGPSGRRLIVAGSLGGAAAPISGAPPLRYIVVSYRATDGDELWHATYRGSFAGAAATSVATSPSGGRVYVTGYAEQTRGPATYVTIAYDAARGRRLWTRLLRHGARDPDISGQDREEASGALVGEPQVVVGPHGRRVFVSGTTISSRSGKDYLVVAYKARTGAVLWRARYNDRGDGDDVPRAVALGPGGHRLVVTGSSWARGHSSDYATVAFDADTGTRLWVARLDGPGHGADTARSVAVGPRGGRVVVTGDVFIGRDPTGGSGVVTRYATVAYDAATGKRSWLRQLGRSSDDMPSEVAASAIAVDRARAQVVVTGNAATVAYVIATGATAWTDRHTDMQNPTPIAVARSGRRVFVTGQGYGPRIGNPAIVTRAYAN